MPWDASPAGGFTAGPARPWLPLGEHAVRNVASQRADAGSVLWLCRRLIALRRASLAGVTSCQRLPAPPGVWCYRTGPLVVAANFSDEPAGLPGPAGEVLLTTHGEDGEAAAPGWLGPWEGAVIRPAP